LLNINRVVVLQNIDSPVSHAIFRIDGHQRATPAYALRVVASLFFRHSYVSKSTDQPASHRANPCAGKSGNERTSCHYGTNARDR
jgi:hypothetical protein